MTKVFTLDGTIINVGNWDYMAVEKEVVNNPYQGEGEAPQDWDYQVSLITVVLNPLPTGALEEDIEIYYDDAGIIQKVSDAENLALKKQLVEYQTELNNLMVDIQLGLASEEDKSKAVSLRTFIKENT